MTEPRFDPDALIDAMAPMLALDIADEDRPSVAANLFVAARFAALVLEAALDEREEPAPVFRP